MRKRILKKKPVGDFRLLRLGGGVVIAAALVALIVGVPRGFAQVWTEPTANPPGNNAAAPIWNIPTTGPVQNPGDFFISGSGKLGGNLNASTATITGAATVNGGSQAGYAFAVSAGASGAIYGWGSNTGNTIYGVNNGNFAGASGVRGDGVNTGVYGSGASYGLYGNGGTYGVYATGSVYGVRGFTAGGATQYAVYGAATYNGTGTAYGVYGDVNAVSAGGSSYGVYGNNNSATGGGVAGFGNTGGYFQTQTADGRGIMAVGGSSTISLAARLYGNVLITTSNGQGLFTLGQLAADPAAANSGGMFYNSATGKLRCNEASTWKDCLGGGLWTYGFPNTISTIYRVNITGAAAGISLDVSGAIRAVVTSCCVATIEVDDNSAGYRALDAHSNNGWAVYAAQGSGFSTPSLGGGGIFAGVPVNGTAIHACAGMGSCSTTGGSVAIQAHGASTGVFAIGGNTGVYGQGATYAFYSQGAAFKSDGLATWTIASDARLKDGVVPFTDGLAVLGALDPVRYTYNGRGGSVAGINGIGLIAQDVKDSAPYLVSTYRAKLDPTDASETDLYEMNQGPLTYVLINAVKEQQAEIEKLTARLEALENR